MTPSLPALPSLEQLKNQAKDLVKGVKAGDPEALRRVRAHLPQSESPQSAAVIALSRAQLVIAREYGFPTWPRLKKHVEASQSELAAGLEAFKQAVEGRDGARLRALFRTIPDLKAHIDDPLFGFDTPAIVRAAGRQDREALDILLEHGADINARSRWWAGGFGVLPNRDPEFAAYLIERGAVVDVWAAASLGRLDRLETLLEEDPSRVNARGGDGQTPLHFASSIDAARLLLDRGAEIDLRDIDHGGTSAQYMAADRPEICRYLLSRGAAPDIFMAVQLGDIDLVKRLLDQDPRNRNARVNSGNLTAGDSDGGHIYSYTLRNSRSPLYLAAELGHTEIYRLLLTGCTLGEQLVAACMAVDEETAHGLLTAHPDLARSLPPEQMRAIADAAWANKPEAVRLMVSVGFDIEARGDEESTALNRAAIRGYADIIDLLLAHGASLDAKNAYGGAALGACIWGAENFRDPKGDYVASVEKLLAAGASIADVKYPCANKPVNAVLRRHIEKLRAHG